MKLYEINSALREKLDQAFLHADQNEGEIPAHLDYEIEYLQQEKADKCLDIGRYCKSLKAEYEAVKAEKMNLDKRQKSISNKMEWLKNYLNSCIQPGEIYKDANTVLSWRKSKSVNIVDQDKLPLNFVETKYIPLKAEIKRAIESGDEVSGAELVEKQNLQIK